MALKHIYLVRHGQTEANKLRFHQSSDESLSPKGRKQAHHVALLLRDLGIDALLCSTYTRARETAGIISDILGLPYTTHASLVEFKRPNYIYGQGYYSPGTLWYIWRLFIHSENENWNDDGAENMFAIRNRALDAKMMLAETEGEHIAVVTHDIFMNIFLELVCRQKKMGFFQFAHGLLLTKKTPNTGIIHLTYDPFAPRGVCEWQLVEFIDPQHRTPLA
jgi:broad specificity phosphatase PhoE